MGIIKRATEDNRFSIEVIDIRDYSKSKHKSVDDYPFGGGAGMLMSIQPLYDAINDNKSEKTIYLSPRGKLLKDKKVRELSQEKEILIICGHYEGIDQRIIDNFVDEEISIGDYILSGGETAALVLIDSIIRFIDGVISRDSLEDESFTNGLLEYNQYTRPRSFEGMEVPEYLFSGNHKLIRKKRLEESVRLTLERRKDLIEENLDNDTYTEEIVELINTLQKEEIHES